MKEKYYELKVVFLTPILGSQPQRDVASEFLAKRAGFINLPEDEIETLPEALDRGTTVFHRDEKSGMPILYDYMVKGFLKNAGKVLNGKTESGVKNLRSKINDSTFVTPRKIELHMPEDGEVAYLERPLRAETAQGPRVALARSEMLPEGTWFTCNLVTLPGDVSESVLSDLLDYGFYMGIGQWRNGSWGQFRYELKKAEED